MHQGIAAFVFVHCCQSIYLSISQQSNFEKSLADPWDIGWVGQYTVLVGLGWVGFSGICSELGGVGLDEVVVLFCSWFIKHMCNYWENPMDRLVGWVGLESWCDGLGWVKKN